VTRCLALKAHGHAADLFSFAHMRREKGEDWLKSLDEPMQLRIAFPALREAYSANGRLRKRQLLWS
jgi:hypothetical protein